MNKKLLFFILVLPVLAILLTGCAEGLTPASWAGITVAGELAYAAAGPQVYAIDLKNGSEVWRFPEKGSPAKPYYAAPVLTSDDQLIVGGYDKVLYSLDPETGGVIWEFPNAQDRWIGSVLIFNDQIYAPNADHKLYILNLDGELQGEPFQADNSLWATPVTDGEKVYFSSLGSTVYALNAETGEAVWQKKIDGAILGGIVLDSDGVLYIGTFSGIMVALDSEDGGVIWQREFPGQIWSTPALSNGTLYFGTHNGTVYAINTQDGSDQWEFLADAPVLGTPLVLESKIVFGTENGALYFVDRQTVKDNRELLVGKLYGNPVLAGELVLVAPVGGDQTLVAFDFDGKQDWDFIPGK